MGQIYNYQLYEGRFWQNHSATICSNFDQNFQFCQKFQSQFLCCPLEQFPSVFCFPLESSGSAFSGLIFLLLKIVLWLHRHEPCLCWGTVGRISVGFFCHLCHLCPSFVGCFQRSPASCFFEEVGCCIWTVGPMEMGHQFPLHVHTSLDKGDHPCHGQFCT